MWRQNGHHGCFPFKFPWYFEKIIKLYITKVTTSNIPPRDASFSTFVPAFMKFNFLHFYIFSALFGGSLVSHFFRLLPSDPWFNLHLPTVCMIFKSAVTSMLSCGSCVCNVVCWRNALQDWSMCKLKKKYAVECLWRDYHLEILYGPVRGFLTLNVIFLGGGGAEVVSTPNHSSLSLSGQWSLCEFCNIWLMGVLPTQNKHILCSQSLKIRV